MIVRVRHLDFGLVNRAFKPRQKMAVVYDWVGSLQLTPVYFSLSSSPGEVIDPSASIEDSVNKVLFMERGDDPIQLLGDDGEVSFKGFGAIEEILPPLLNRTLKLGDIWARWPAKPPCSLLSTGIGTNMFKTSILK